MDPIEIRSRLAHATGTDTNDRIDALLRKALSDNLIIPNKGGDDTLLNMERQGVPNESWGKMLSFFVEEMKINVEDLILIGHCFPIYGDKWSIDVLIITRRKLDKSSDISGWVVEKCLSSAFVFAGLDVFASVFNIEYTLEQWVAGQRENTKDYGLIQDLKERCEILYYSGGLPDSAIPCLRHDILEIEERMYVKTYNQLLAGHDIFGYERQMQKRAVIMESFFSTEIQLQKKLA